MRQFSSFGRWVRPVLATGLFALASLGASAQVKLDISVPWGPNEFHSLNAARFAERVKQETKGEVVMTTHPGGTLGVTVPTWWPEKINWMLSDEYHAPKSVGGHVRIYSATELKAKLRSAGLDVTGSHHAHALHSPYWWLKCAVGPRNDDHALVKKYREFLEWDIISHPRSMQIAERALSPLMGKSFVVYSTKPIRVGASA